MPIAIASYTLPDPATPAHEIDTSTREVLTVSGEGDTWEAAKEACDLPVGAMVLHWTRG